MSWQEQTYKTLIDGKPHRRADLFDAVSAQIPLHHATRFIARQRHDEKLLPNWEARWRFFNFTLSRMGIETNGSPRIRKFTDSVWLRPLANRSCSGCGGPVFKTGWTATLINVHCLVCGTSPAAAPVPPPQPIPQPVASPEPITVLPIAKTAPAPFEMIYVPPVQLTTIVKPTMRWFYQRRRAFLEYIKTVRLPGFSVSKLQKLLTGGPYHNDPQKLLKSLGQPPIRDAEFEHWHNNYQRQHPP